MPSRYADYLDPRNPKFLPALKGLYSANDFMTWSFYGGILDPERRSRENVVFMLCLDPDHIRPMMDGLDNLDQGLVDQMKQERSGVLVGRERLKMIGKRVGDPLTVTGFNYKGIDLEFKIVGQLPVGRYNFSAIMNASYLRQALDDYARKNKVKHPLEDNCLNVIWLRAADKPTFKRIKQTIEAAPCFAALPVKCELADDTASWILSERKSR
jgi:putative ABC transport system permease protein